ncbi:MAG: response regulator [Desulfobacterales bacterium]|nr:response regulator [Desulfobacterales bacterium]MBF0396038.1 response regulator [Desulfobacterales bacterium]
MIQKSTILIVDDESAILNMLESLLMATNLNLIMANNGTEALKKAYESHPDLILLDVMMPDIDGFDVCKKIRSEPQLSDIPIIMITGLDDQDSRLMGIESGADDFIAKPFNPIELRARVNTILRLNRYRRITTERMKFEWVVEQSSNAYLLINKDDQILYANHKALVYLDLPPSYKNQAISQTFTEIVKKRYTLEPTEGWNGWPTLSDFAVKLPRFLVQPESISSKAFLLQVDLYNMPSGIEGEKLIRLRDMTKQISVAQDVRVFHTIISHKLRTPLFSIVNGLELLCEDVNKLPDEKLKTLSNISLQGAYRLYSQIEDILKYVDTPKIAVIGNGCKLSMIRKIAQEALKTLDLQASVINENEPLNGEISLSDKGIEWILLELLENSRKFHPKKSPSIEINITHKTTKELIIQIIDNGQTLSPEYLAQVWNPYYQAEKRFTGEVEGMGLGLAMVAALVWEAGGKCNLYNRDKAPGIVVEINLPFVE